LGGLGWLRVGLSLLAVGLAGYGGFQASHNIRDRTLNFWFLLHTQGATAFQAEGAGMAPQITDHHWVSGHRMRLEWTSMGSKVAYRVYWTSPDGKDIWPVGEDVSTLGAIVDVNPALKEGSLDVTAIGAGDIESAHSNKVGFFTTPENGFNQVEPLPISEPEEGTSAEPAQKAATPHKNKAALSHKATSSSIASGIPATTSGITTQKASVKKPSFFAAFGRNLLKGADGVIHAVAPGMVGTGVVATKNAATDAHDETATPSSRNDTVGNP
jgi:hypothetical protein